MDRRSASDQAIHSSDQPKLTNVVDSSDNLRRLRNQANIMKEAQGYSLQKGGTSKNFCDTVFNRDSQNDERVSMLNCKEEIHQNNNELKRECTNSEENKQDIKISKQEFQKKINMLKQMRGLLEKEKEDLKQKNQNLEQERIRERELKEILKKAKPGLSPKVKEAYYQLEILHRRAEVGDIVSNDEHGKVFEDLLGYLSPGTLREHKEHGTEFVINPNAELSYPVVEKIAEDKCEIKLPLPYKHQIKSLMLRAIDLLLETEWQLTNDIPSPRRRAEIATRVFQANFRLGQGELGRYGFSTRGYDLAEKYYKDYKDGIRQAFKDGRISKDDPKEKLIEIGHTYAHAKYLESIKPPQGVPCVFPSLQPGAYLEELDIWGPGQRPMKEESPEFKPWMRTLDERKQRGENFSLTVTILPSKEMWVQPYFHTKGLYSGHATTAFGNHCTWAGEADIDYKTRTLLRLKDQSGHYKPFNKDNPGCMIAFALEQFKERGYDTSTTIIELTTIEGFEKFKYENYKLRTRDDLKDSGGLTPSEQYLDEFSKKRGTSDIDGDGVD